MYLVAASIIATLGTDGVVPLKVDDLESLTERGNTDGDIIVRKIESFLSKKDLLVRTLSNTLLTENINKVENGET